MSKKPGLTLIVISSNRYRPSEADPTQTILYGPLKQYRAENWILDYFTVGKSGDVIERTVTCKLPEGYEQAMHYIEHFNKNDHWT